MNAFKAYDIRGVYGVDITEDLAYQVGRCLPTLLNAKRVLIGHDVRLSSPALREALVNGLTEAGANVEDMGLCTTPMTYFFTAEKGYDAAVMITASHNPKQYNGLKVTRAGALPCGYMHGLNKVEQWITEGYLPPKAETLGTVTEVHYHDEYVAWMKARLPNLSDLRFAVDCSNGAASVLARKIFGEDAIYINDTPDGNFPNHGPNPLDVANCEQLMACIKEHQLDMGIIFDGDADRVMCVDERGTFVQPDILLVPMAIRHREMALSAGETLEEYPKIIHDVRTSRSVMECLNEVEFTPFMVKVGGAFAKAALREQNALCGAEVAGHYYYKMFHWNDSGMLAAIDILAIAAGAKVIDKTFSEVLAPIADRYVRSGEVNVHDIQDRPAAIARVEKAILELLGAPIKRIDFDGVRLDWSDAWFGVRASNTEPILRLAGEAQSQAKLDHMIEVAKRAAVQ